MQLFAHIVSGAVREIVQIPVGAQLSDCFQASFAQDCISCDGTVTQGMLWDGHSFSPPPAPPAPTFAQQAAAALANGCQIVSTGTPALSGAYAIDPAAQSKIQATALYIQVNGKFPAGKSALPWADAGGTVHTFGTTAEFTAFATAIGDYVTELEMVILGQSTTLPAQPVTIA